MDYVFTHLLQIKENEDSTLLEFYSFGATIIILGGTKALMVNMTPLEVICRRYY